MSFGIAEIKAKINALPTGDMEYNRLCDELEDLRVENETNHDFLREYLSCYPRWFCYLPKHMKETHEFILIYLKNFDETFSLNTDWMLKEEYACSILPKLPYAYLYVEEIDNPKIVKAAAQGIIDGDCGIDDKDYYKLIMYLRIFKTEEVMKRGIESMEILIQLCDDMIESTKAGNRLKKVERDVNFYFLNSGLKE